MEASNFNQSSMGGSVMRFKSICAAMALAGFAVHAAAAPINYSIAFDGSGSGLPGTGGFTYDAATNQMTGFNWDFGGGQTGGVLDSYFASHSATTSFFFDNILWNLTGNPLTIGYAFKPLSPSVFGPFGEDMTNFCWGIASSPWCLMPNLGISRASYYFEDNGDTEGKSVYKGYMTVSTNGVPEPTSLALLLAGLPLAGWMRSRRRKA
jgi:hypothetical protein